MVEVAQSMDLKSYDQYRKSIEEFNASIKSAFADVYNKLSAISDLNSRISRTVNDISTLNTRISQIEEKQNRQGQQEADDILRLNQALDATYKNLSSQINALSVSQSDLNGKVNKLSDTLFKGLPAINATVDEVGKIKTEFADIKARFNELSNRLDAFNVQMNGLQLKIDGFNSSFKSVESNLSSMQANLLDFINVANAVNSTLSRLDPDTIAINFQHHEDRIKVLEQEINNMIDENKKMHEDLSDALKRLSIIKPANIEKLLEQAGNVLNASEEQGRKVEATAAHVDSVFEQLDNYLKKINDVSTRTNELNSKLFDLSAVIDGLNSKIATSATKEDIMEINKKISDLADNLLALNQKLNDSIKPGVNPQ